jgi:hypothetical protein
MALINIFIFYYLYKNNKSTGDGIRTHAMFKVVHKTRFLTRVSPLFSASANLTPGFLLQDIFHHDLRFIALCPSSELHPYIIKGYSLH